MSVNSVDIKVVTDYTAYTNTVRFEVEVPLTSEDATTIYKDLAAGVWATTEADITTAVKKTAPTQIQTLVTTLLQAYSGTTSSTPDPNSNPTQDPTQDPNNGGGG